MGKIYKVQAAAPGGPPRDIKLALAEAARTGILEIPGDVVALTISSGVKIEVTNVKN